MKLRVGMLGTIDHIKLFVDPASKREDIELVGIAETDTAKGKETADKYGTRLFSSNQPLLAEGLDAVGIFTPFAHRAEDIVQCLELGLHVMTDKPAAVNAKDLKQLRSALKRHPDLRFTMGLVVRTLPASRKIKQLIQDGAIGKPVTVSTRKSYTLRRGKRPTWMFDSALSGGEWVELAVHDVDLVRWLVGKDYLTVTATHGNGTSPTEPYQDHGAGLFTLEDGIAAFIEHNRLNPSTPGEDLRWHLTIVGTEGVIDQGGALRLWNGSGSPKEVTDLPGEVSFFGNFVDAVREKEALLVPQEDVLRVTEVALGAFESSEKGGKTIALG